VNGYAELKQKTKEIRMQKTDNRGQKSVGGSLSLEPFCIQYSNIPVRHHSNQAICLKSI
jgi:hypothetical protein